MSLAAYEIPTRPVMSRDAEIFRVRGLNVEDLTYLAENYLPDIIQAIEAYGQSRRRVVERKGLAEFVLIAAKDFPSLCAEMISRAADEPGQTDKARALPFMIQIAALKEIIVLSTEEAGGLKNLIAVLAAALEIDQPTATNGFGELRKRLLTIIGDSERASASLSGTDTERPPATH